MKKKLESELVSIAHRILKLTGREDINKLHEEVAVLYEKLTVLKFAQENFEDRIPKIGHDSSFFDMLDTAFNNKYSDNIEIEDKTYVHLDETEDDGIMEPVMSKIKDLVSHMPDEDVEEKHVIEETPTSEKVLPKETEAEQSSIDFEDITSGFDEMPEFEPIEVAQKRDVEVANKSLNDKLKGQNLKIGLNDKLAFIKHLFEGENEDYDRVISQINTIGSLPEAKTLILEMVKPDYNNWVGKEDYEERFLQLIEGKFN
ncbi:hypothetical protein ADIWIN_2607 [Winogradskyella psychrotolerans RS-3]|uniref:Uncharacterized protein n=1 Tax=Winogradskyella psychrotolerans RS-3 TaxID=641526 RepID=S7VST9_9FLAO|nr:hypothetical protein [Winogradskyella psychrotolerans]EPR72437.1 hypothetical protein ADIWIN_2607 [Winogradskyella psychrotolerans RS-3]